MPMTSTPMLIAIATGVLAVAAPAAQADRSGEGAVNSPRRLTSVHTEFTLPGIGWAQNISASSGAPRLGLYVLDVPMPTADTCRIFVSVRATGAKRRPTVRGHTVALTLGSTRELLRFNHHGRHGSVRWWTGSQAGSNAAGIAYQPMPKNLRTTRRPWLVYRFSVTYRAVPNVEHQCENHARKTGARTVRSIGRTLKLAGGPAQSHPPVLAIP